MKENTLNKILVIFCLLAVFSCKARKLATPTAAVVKQPSALTVELNNIRAHQITFTTFSGKARTSLDINGNKNDVTMNVRIAHDKKIWVSITALLGIEVARAVITPDSVMIINRIQGLYVKKPFSFIYAYANKQVDYGMLQALLVGNAVPSLLREDAKFDTTNNMVALSGNLADVVYKLMLNAGLKVTQTNLDNTEMGASLQVTNNNFIQSGTQQLPSQIDIASVAKDKKIQVNLHYIKVDLNQPQEYPFSIPLSYSPQN